MALRARTPGLTAQAVNEARTRERSIVWTWAMRGTLHLVAADDVAWLVPLTTAPRVSNAYRRLAQEGITADQADDALMRIDRILARDGPRTRNELAEELRRRRIRTEGQAIAHLLWLAAARGIACRGPDRGAETCFVRLKDWLPPLAPVNREAALAELAVRFLGAHGPSEPVDLGTWAGLGARDTAQAWRSVEDRLIELGTARDPRWMLRSARGPAPAPAGTVRLLPAFDEYLLGWKDRGFEVDRALLPRINRGGGWIHPVVLADGRAVATWGLERSGAVARIRVQPLDRAPARLRTELRGEIADVARFLGASTAELEID
jgi:hypothetical protein